jgi:UDP-3-O-[3-hydroxymyristoyl] glucosamine N-acyltransferase
LVCAIAKVAAPAKVFAMHLSLTAEDLAAIVQPLSTKGSTTETIRGIAALRTAQPGDLSFLGNLKYKGDVTASAASAVLVAPKFAGEPGPNQLLLFVVNPSLALARVCARIEQQLWPKPAPGIHPTAWVAPGARVAASATVGPLCVVEAGASVGERSHLQAQVFLGRNARVGDDCWLMPGSTVATECTLHERVRLQPGVVIGSDGFGYEFTAGHYDKVPQVGGVEIHRDVEIGANSTVDRARFGLTIIGEGTKIDNLVQIGHNVTIGRHCILCGQVGISGSCTIEDFVIFGGQSGAAGHLTFGKGSRIDGQAGVREDLPAGSSAKGSPSLPFQLEQRINVLRQRLPALFRRVDDLEAELARLKKSSAT